LNPCPLQADPNNNGTVLFQYELFVRGVRVETGLSVMRNGIDRDEVLGDPVRNAGYRFGVHYPLFVGVHWERGSVLAGLEPLTRTGKGWGAARANCTLRSCRISRSLIIAFTVARYQPVD